MDYRTKGVCSQSIHFDIEDNKIHNVSFVGGCNGNLQGISHLVEGMDVNEAISRLEGIQCGFKKTSCPDQLSQEASHIEFYVRKAAHMTEYCLLSISISFPLYVYGVRGIWLVILAGFVCVGFAGLDEYHQSFVDARGPSVRDVGIDSCGALIGILLVQAFCWSTLHTPGRKKSRKKRRKNQRHR